MRFSSVLIKLDFAGICNPPFVKQFVNSVSYIIYIDILFVLNASILFWNFSRLSHEISHMSIGDPK